MATDPSVRSRDFSRCSDKSVWHGDRVKNYLPDMTWPEVESLLSRTDMVIVPITAIYQHGPQLPIGTDYYTGEELKGLCRKSSPAIALPQSISCRSTEAEADGKANLGHSY